MASNINKFEIREKYYFLEFVYNRKTIISDLDWNPIQV